MTPLEAGGEGPLTLQGGTNFRDLGGHPTADGGRVRHGVVFRSGTLHRLTRADLEMLEQLGLRVVYDLRADEERERAPSVLPDGIRCELLPIRGPAAKTAERTEVVLTGALADAPPDFLERIYAGMAEAAAPTFGQLLAKMAEPDGVPGLVHCTAGKDRTGLAAALLLSVLGVVEAAILDDYELSAVHYTERQIARLTPKLAAAGVTVDRYRTVFGAPRTAMATLLATLRERHGSVEAYLGTEGGVASTVFDALRARLVEDIA